MRWRMMLIVAFLGLLFGSSAFAENRALLVGCDRFLTQEDTWPASSNNVRQIATALTGGSESFVSFVAIPGGVGSGAELEKRFAEAFRGTAEDDVSYIYISTHGLWEQDAPDESFELLLSDGRSEERYSVLRLRDLLSTIPGRKLLILDTCHSGAVIGKGAPVGTANLFAGTDVAVLCSCGAAEESWFWSAETAEGHAAVGAGFFSGALVSGISASGAFGADSNRDGAITLREMEAYLRACHGASTCRVYPEDSDWVAFRYDPEQMQLARRRALISAVTFGTGAISIAYPSISLSFIVQQPVRVGYQLIQQKDGRWDFAGAEFFFDDAELADHPDMPRGLLGPGYKERQITLHTEDEDYGEGYVLLQILTVTDSAVSVAASTVLCVPPAQGDPGLRLRACRGFHPALGEECAISVAHGLPCELTVTVLDDAERMVRRLMTRDPSRPEQLSPEATTCYWNGTLSDGTPAPEGFYTIRVSAMVGDTLWYAEDAKVWLSRESGPPPAFPHASPFPARVTGLFERLKEQ